MLKFGQEERLSLEIGDGFFMLRVVEVLLDHFLDGAGRIPKVSILSEINCAHATASDTAHDLIPMI